MRAHEILREIHSSDLYPKAFTVFRRKYAPQVDNPRLYVNFTDVVGNTVDKTFSPKPNHHDPAGLYTYPLDYVLRHSSEIQYGQQARYLRVILDTSQHKLVLNTLDQPTAEALLSSMGIIQPRQAMARVQRRFKYVGGNLIAKQFFGVIQMGIEVGQKRMTSNALQTTLLRKAGIDALEDKSHSDYEAIIYRDEPEQCIFLTRSAFRIIDFFELRSDRSRDIARADPREMLKRLPGLIAQAIGDRIVANNLTGDRADKFSFYTAAKRKIVVMTSKVYSFQTSHRGGAEHSSHKLTVALMGPDFAPITVEYDANVPFQQIAADMAKRFHDREPAKGQTYDLAIEHGPEIKQINDLVKMITTKLKVPYTPPSNDTTAFRVYRTIKSIEAETTVRYLSRDKLRARVDSVVKRLWPDNRQPQGQQIKDMYNAAAERKSMSGPDLNRLTSIARRLKLIDYNDVKKSGEEHAKTYGDLTIFRRGTDLMTRVGTTEHKVATIDNLQLTDWKRPAAEYDYTVLLPHAKALADYLNENHFTVDGYATYLPQFFGIVYDKGTWKVFEKSAKKIDQYGKIAIRVLPPDKNDHRHVVGVMRGETDHSNLGAVPNEKWQGLIIILTLNQDNEVTSIGHDLATHLRQEEYRKKNPSRYSYKSYPDDMYLGKRGGETIYKELLEDGHFDLIAFIKKHGFKLSGSMFRDADLFGLVVNQDTGKMGKTYGDVMERVGTFAGRDIYSVVPHRQWTSNRHYIIRRDDKLHDVAQTERDPYTGKNDVKVEKVANDLDVREREALATMFAEKKIHVPTKFRPLLAYKRLRRGY